MIRAYLTNNILMQELNPVISQANYHQFSNKHKTSFMSVESRMFLWCKSGKGKIRINKKTYNVERDDYFILPWRHKISYEADAVQPFYVAGIHLIPWHDPNEKISWGETAHGEDHPMYDVLYRKDREIKGLEELKFFKVHAEHPLLLLSEFIIKHFLGFSRSEISLKHSAFALLEEACLAIRADQKESKSIKLLRSIIEKNVSVNLSLKDLAKEIKRSPSQVNRICKMHLNVSPGNWINQCKIEHACQLLLNFDLSVREVAERCGYQDQFHFSRLFKRFMGLSPLKYRQRRNLI